MSLEQRYLQDLNSKGFVPDPVQRQAIASLQHLSDMLNKMGKRSQDRVRRLLLGEQRIPGIYLWGGVGRGKTYLMDMFFDSLQDIGKQCWIFMINYASCPNRLTRW